MASVKARYECLMEWLAVREQKKKKGKPRFSKTKLYKHNYKTQGIV